MLLELAVFDFFLFEACIIRPLQLACLLHKLRARTVYRLLEPAPGHSAPPTLVVRGAVPLGIECIYPRFPRTTHMYRLLGLSQNKPSPDLQQAIANTESRADTTQDKIQRLDAELGRYRDQMKRMRDGPGKSAVQQRALRVLKQKRMYESQLEQLTQQSFNMEQSVMATDNLRNTMATVDAMQLANKELRKTYGKLDVDKVEQMQDEMEDLLEQSSALQETMSRSYGVPDDIDEAELEAELEALYAREADPVRTNQTRSRRRSHRTCSMRRLSRPNWTCPLHVMLRARRMYVGVLTQRAPPEGFLRAV